MDQIAGMAWPLGNVGVKEGQRVLYGASGPSERGIKREIAHHGSAGRILTDNRIR